MMVRAPAVAALVMLVAAAPAATLQDTDAFGPHAIGSSATGPDASGRDGSTSVWIVQPDRAGGLADIIAQLEGLGLRHHIMERLGMATFVGTAADAAQLSGARVEPNQRLPLHLDRSVAYIEADAVRRKVGPARDDAVVLVVDTGVDSAHPDFRTNLVANVQPEVQGGLVVGDLAQMPVVDPAGHGTHIGGIVAGSGEGFGDGGGKYQGVYSNGRLASYQVTLDPPGSDDPQVDTAAALQAFEWALANRARYDLAVVTNSWGAPGAFDPGAAVNQATLRLYEAGLVVVFSAGNEGRDGPDSLNKYCMAPWVLCVAAGDLGGSRAPFSSLGADDAPYKHPDLTAPGSQIMSTHPTTGLGDNLRTGTPSSSLYSERSGTSMAAPHVAATAALLLAGNPSLSPDQVMDILVATTDPMADPVERVGSGYLNARAAYNLAMGTTGQRDRFLDGQVKYAGRDSGDARYERDPVSVGYDGALAGIAIIPAPPDPVWLVSSPMAWVLAGLAVVSVCAGIEWRPRPAQGVRSVPPVQRAVQPHAQAPAQRASSPVRTADQDLSRRTGPTERV